MVGRAGHGPQNGAGLSDGAEQEGHHEDASRQSRRERQTVREGDVQLAEEHAQHDAQGDGKEVGVGQLLVVIAQQACHAFDAVFLAHHHQLVAELQRQVGRGGEVDTASADAGDGTAEVLHQVEVAQLFVYHILLGEQQGFNLLHVYEWQFAFFALAHEDGKLVQGIFAAHGLYAVSLVQDGLGGGDGYLLIVLMARDDGTGHGARIDLHQAAAEDGGVGHAEQAGCQFRELAAAFLLQPARLLVEVDAHDTGQQLDEENHADNAERIGNTVSDGCQWGMGAVNGYGKSRCTGQGAGYEAHHAGGVYVEGVLQSYGCEGGGADDEQGDDDKRLALATEGVEESGTGLDADGEDEQHQSEVS